MLVKVCKSLRQSYRTWLYQYRLCLALDVCEPWEQTVVYTLSLVFVALFCFATLLFVPSQITSVCTFFQMSSD
ncbi:uncharacterized protein DEA37_0005334 [Paragonimus westermani]|uniref:Serine palmitoyltransferase small subunit B n=1 Tax=Paragonimus westermani TaxID=34504 RepID=A0A5J4N9T5_9TREM|nr:uncharacterized protein DEA37_0005334 [Paragonimus westermani]